MQFHGGKERIAQELVEVMLKHTPHRHSYLEPFVGGASVLSRMAPHFDRVDAGDASLALITLWSAAADGWAPPEELSREEYGRLRVAADPGDPLTAFAAHGCSFGGKRWDGWASNARGDKFARAASRGVVRKAKTLGGVRFTAGDYRDWMPAAGTVVYADPPYAGTTGYGEGWDADAFWRTMERWARDGATVFVSEYHAPPGWRTIYSRTRGMNLSANDNRRVSTENLFAFEIEETP